MAMRASDPETFIRALPIWRGGIEIEPLLGGITNKNYLVEGARRRVVVRFGGDIPVHGVMRFNELAASRAAAAGGDFAQGAFTPRRLFWCSTSSRQELTAPRTCAPIASAASLSSSACIASSPAICADRPWPSMSSISSAIMRIR